ncbi:MAG: flagellar biosynthesis anti-sigma factor FlgM [Stellaceae bacterium]
MPDSIHAVNPTQPPDVALTGSAQAPPAQGGAAAQPAPGAVDSADVARAELLLATIATAGRSIPAIDQSRVAELQSAILSGSYQIDPKQIAQKIAEIEQLLVPEGS